VEELFRGLRPGDHPVVDAVHVLPACDERTTPTETGLRRRMLGFAGSTANDGRSSKKLVPE
jgi:hypothetical protein